MPTYVTPDVVAHELTDKAVAAVQCKNCEKLGFYCSFHEGYLEGVLVLLLKASAE